MKEKVSISMPTVFLLVLAAYGNMGDGEIPELMQVWAQKELVNAGMKEDLIAYQKDRMRQLESNLRNVLGDGPVDSLLTDISKAAQVLKTALDQG